MSQMSSNMRSEVSELISSMVNKTNNYFDVDDIIEAKVRLHNMGNVNNDNFHVKNIKTQNDLSSLKNKVVEKFNAELTDYAVFYAGKELGTLVYTTLTNKLCGSIQMSVNNDHFYIEVLGDNKFCELARTHFDKEYQICNPCILNRVYYNKSYGEFTTTPLIVEDVKPHVSENYPYISQSADELWNGFFESNSNLMMFIGPPGTGKSHLIRNIANAHGWDKEDVFIIDSKQALDKEELINFFYEIKPNSLVAIEDADLFVQKREKGNEQMSGILNVLAGVSGNNIKFIVSTNLPSLKDVDTAFIRPGRCYKTIEFKKLVGDEINICREKNGKSKLDNITKQTSLTLAQVLNYEDNGTKHLVSNNML